MNGRCATTTNRAIALATTFGLALLAMTAGRSTAATMEQAVAQCREQLTPIVRACVRAQMMANQDRNPEKYIPGCRAKVTAQGKACVAKLIGATGDSSVTLPPAGRP